jgi:hypothetical protein
LFANGILPSFPALGAGATCTVSVNVTTNSSGVFDNKSGELLAGGLSSGFATARLNVPIQFLNKVFINDPVAPGGNVTLQFTIQNPSRTSSATGIAFTDDLDAALTGLTFDSLLSNDCGGTVGGVGTTNINFSGGTLAPEGLCTISVGLTVPVSASPGTYTNTTSAVTATIDGSPVVGNMATDQLTINFAPTFTKEFIDDPVGAGGTTTLRFTITNTSSLSSLSSIAFTDTLSDVLPTASVVPTNPVCNTGTGSFTPFIPNNGGTPARFSVTGASLDPGASCTIDLILNVSTSAATGTYNNTTSSITGLLGGEEPVEGRAATDDLVVVGAPRLEKEFIDDPAQPGGNVTLRFTITHDEFAPGDATNITFSDDLDATLTGLSASGATVNTCGGMATSGFPTGNFGYSGGSLTPGSSCTIELSLDVPANAAGGSYTNTTSNITADVGGVGVTGTPATDVLRIAGIILTKEFIDDPVVPGDTTTLRFTLNNINPNDDATGIQFTDNLAAVLPGTPDLTAVGPLSTGTCNGSLSGTTSLSYSGGSLLAGTSCSFDVTIQVPAGAADGTYSNVTSIVIATLGGSSFVGDPATDNLTINSNFLQLTKEFTDDPVAPGGNVTLEFNLTNLNATQAASAIGFTDDLNATLSGLTFDSVLLDTCGGTVSGTGSTAITVSGVSLAAAGSCTIRVNLSVPANAPPNSIFTNTTSGVTGTINGLAVTGDAATDNLSIGTLDIIAPVVTYTPIPHTTSTMNPTLSVTATDAVGVDRTTIFFRINNGAFTSNPCTLVAGTAQNGTWNCTIPGMLTNPSAIAYYVSAQDLAPNIGSSPVAGVAAPNLFTIGAGVVPAGTYTNMSLSGGSTFGGDVNVLGILTLGGIVGPGSTPLRTDSIVNGGATVTLGCNATISGGGPTNYLIGNLAKQFCTTTTVPFIYPVGTAADNSVQSVGVIVPEYSPFTANITALGTSPSTLTVSVTDTFLPNSDPLQSASRYWNVTETGDLTADISYTYLNQDVNGDENNYKVLRLETSFTEVFPGGMVDSGTNTATATGVTNFSRWAAGNLGPTAALVNIGGRVLTPSGRGISGARVYLTSADGNVVVRRTNPFGYYRFSDIPVGETYVLRVKDKTYKFAEKSRVLFIAGDDFGINFTATGLNAPGNPIPN